MPSQHSTSCASIGDALTRSLVTAAFCVWSISAPVAAQGSGAGSGKPAPALPTLDSVRVLAVFSAGQAIPLDSTAKRSTVRAGLGDIIRLRVRDLYSLSNRARCLSREGETVGGCRERKIALFLEGREIKALMPESGAPQPGEALLQFHLQRGADSEEQWADILGSPSLGSSFFLRPTEVSVGLADEYPLPTDVRGDRFELVRIREGWFYVGVVGTIVILGLLIWLAVDSELLRDVGPIPAKGSAAQSRVFGLFARSGPHKPFSLARVQMAFWSSLIVMSFVFIWLVTGGLDSITGSVLGLMGIGAGTALGAATIDAGKRSNTEAEHDALDAEQSALDTEIGALRTQVAAPVPPANLVDLQASLVAKTARRDAVAKRLGVLGPAIAPRTSDGFWSDVLTDATDGVSFHRFQMLVWTIILGIMFVHAVWHRLSMPQFSGTLLALLGISNGTYLGFKIPEQAS